MLLLMNFHKILWQQADESAPRPLPDYLVKTHDGLSLLVPENSYKRDAMKGKSK